jgi:hypothetical protein
MALSKEPTFVRELPRTIATADAKPPSAADNCQLLNILHEYSFVFSPLFIE